MTMCPICPEVWNAGFSAQASPVLRKTCPPRSGRKKLLQMGMCEVQSSGRAQLVAETGPQVGPRHELQYVLSCSVTLKKKQPFLGKTILSGAVPTKKKKEKGATEQLSFTNLRLHDETGSQGKHKAR